MNSPRLSVALVIASCVLSVVTGLVLSRGGSSASSPHGGATPSARATPLIGLSLDTLKEERWQQDRDLFVARAKELGAEVLVQSANGDDTRQIADIQSLISNKVDALVIVPHNGAAMAKGVALAREAGIPVLAYDRLIPGEGLDLYVTFDNRQVGRQQAEFLAKTAPADRPLRLIRIYGAKTDNNAVLFKQGQDDIIDPLVASGRIQVVHEDWAADWKPENAKRIANAAITKIGAEGFDAILASNDGTAGGAIQALLEEGLAGKRAVTGQDAERAACQRIVAGTQAMTIYKPLKALARLGAEAAVKFARRQTVVANATVHNGTFDVPSILLPTTAVTRENLDATVIADAFHTREAIYGTAP
jgi:D-xylose transport system substrate-binding protein